MKFKMIALATLFASASFAETESFNMTVSGDVIKDYCTIDVPLTSFDFGTIDTSDLSGYTTHTDATSAVGQTAYLIPTAQSMTVTCASGTLYDVYPDIATNGQALGTATVVGFDLTDVGGATTLALSSQTNALPMTGDGSAQQIDVNMWFASSTGNLNDLEDSVSTVIPWVLQTN